MKRQKIKSELSGWSGYTATKNSIESVVWGLNLLWICGCVQMQRNGLSGKRAWDKFANERERVRGQQGEAKLEVVWLV